MTRPVLFAALTSVAVLGLLPAAWAQEASDTGQTAVPATEQAAPADPTAASAEITIPDMVQGQADAPVTLIEYASYTCPHCAAFHGDQYQKLKDEYIETGKVKYIFREVYFDRFGLWASMIARCGGDMRFFGLTEVLYEEQRDWVGGGDPAAIAENLRRIGRTAGMDDATLDACLKDEAQAEALVAWFQQNAQTDGIEATPTLIINGEKHSNMSYEELKGIIDAELAEAGQ